METFYKTVKKLKKEGGRSFDQILAIAYNHLRKECGVPKDYKPEKLTPAQIVAYGNGKAESVIEEKIYPGTIGIEEIFKFYKSAPAEKVKEWEDLIRGGKLREAIAVIEDFLGVRFSPFVKRNTIHFLKEVFEVEEQPRKIKRADRIIDEIQKISKLVNEIKNSTFRNVGEESEEDAEDFVVEDGHDNDGYFIIIAHKGTKQKFWVPELTINRFKNMIKENKNSAIKYLKRVAIDWQEI